MEGIDWGGLGLLAFMALFGFRAWLRHKQAGGAGLAMGHGLPELDEESQVTLTMAVLVAHERGDPEVNAAHFLGAAASSPAIAEAFVREGQSVDEVRRFAASLLGPGPGAHHTPPLDLTMSEILQHASMQAIETDAAAIHMGLVMAALATHEKGEVGRFLRRTGAAFDQLPVTTTAPAAGDEDDGQTSYVYICNDASTSMEDVSRVLRVGFGMKPQQAMYVMLAVHVRGFAALGPYAPGAARDKAHSASALAKELGLQLCIELDAPDTSGWKQGEHGLLPS